MKTSTAFRWVTVALLGVALGAPPRCRADEARDPVIERWNERHEAIKTPDDLARYVALLNAPATRLDALAVLSVFSHFKLYQIGSVRMIDPDRKIDVLQEQAAQEVRRFADFDTVSRALGSSDSDVQFFGAWFYRGGLFRWRTAKTGEHMDDWVSLKPKAKKLAVEGDARLRSLLIDDFLGDRDFVADRLQKETDPFIILKMIQAGSQAETSARFTPYLLRLLSNQDEAVRSMVLGFIGMNWNSAPMWQVEFAPAVRERVTELSRSSSKDERAMAQFAIKGLQKPLNAQ